MLLQDVLIGLFHRAPILLFPNIVLTLATLLEQAHLVCSALDLSPPGYKHADHFYSMYPVKEIRASGQS